MKLMVSLVCPVYNAENYLRDCINSVLLQTFTSWELILVNDGSQDNSGQICEEYSLKDSRIKVIHKKNSGASSARNCGIDNSSGMWISFIDADDYIDPDYLEKLTSICEDCDMALSGYKRVYSDGSIVKYESINLNCSTPKEIGENLFTIESLTLLNSQCMKLFNKNIIINNSIRFIEGLSVSEDMIFCFECLKHCTKIISMDYVGYNYRMESTSSLSKQIFDFQIYWESIHIIYKLRKECITLFKCVDPLYIIYIDQELFNGCIWATRSFRLYSLREILVKLSIIREDINVKYGSTVINISNLRTKALSCYLTRNNWIFVYLLALLDKYRYKLNKYL